MSETQMYVVKVRSRNQFIAASGKEYTDDINKAMLFSNKKLDNLQKGLGLDLQEFHSALAVYRKSLNSQTGEWTPCK